MAADVAVEYELPPRKKPKVSELPLSSAQRASIDGMLHIFKKKGEFDTLRKKAFQQYNESAQRGLFEASLRSFITGEIDRDPLKYLKPDRRMGAPLLEGAAARGNVYSKTEDDVDVYIEQYLANARPALREIRRKEVGEEAATEEERRGATTDEVYATEAGTRRKQRAEKHKEELRIRRKKEVQERKKKELEALKKKQEELMKETERLQREQKRRAEREAWKAAEKEKERERIRKYNEERERQKKEVEEREKRAQEEKEQRQKEQLEREQKRLEEEALESLLREGRAMADKTRRPDRERSESMDTPFRPLRSGGAPRSLASKDEMRSQGLMPTSLTLRRGDRPLALIPDTRDTSNHNLANESTRHGDHRAHSPSLLKDSVTRHRRESSREDSQRARNDRAPRGNLYRDISAEREAWKARVRNPRAESKGGEEGEVVERGTARARSRSRDSVRRRRESRSPPRRRYRESSRSRSPHRHRDRSRRRERSRSPPGIDRYVPGGSARRNVKEDNERHTNRRSRDENDRDFERRRRDGGARYDERVKGIDIDRYVPPGGTRTEEVDSIRRAERPRSGERDRERERDRDRNRNRGRSRSRSRSRERRRSRARDDR